MRVARQSTYTHTTPSDRRLFNNSAVDAPSKFIFASQFKFQNRMLIVKQQLNTHNLNVRLC